MSLKWEEARERRTSTSCVEMQVQFDSHPEPTTLPGALAYTTPYRQVDLRIHVFIDRVLRGQRTGAVAEANLGLVLAHEIGHVLAGVSHHSPEGVMKPDTPGADVVRNKMTFARLDVALIQAGLVKRMERRLR